MNDREKTYDLLSRLPDSKISYVLAYAQGLYDASEAEDDAFCEAMYQRYLADDDPEKDVSYDLDDCKKEWGIS